MSQAVLTYYPASPFLPKDLMAECIGSNGQAP